MGRGGELSLLPVLHLVWSLGLPSHGTDHAVGRAGEGERNPPGTGALFLPMQRLEASYIPNLTLQIGILVGEDDYRYSWGP